MTTLLPFSVVFALFLLASIEGRATKAPRKLSMPRSRYTNMDCEWDVNYIRRRYATEQGIGNMNKLVYDFDLALALEKQHHDNCTDPIFKSQTHSGEVYRDNLKHMGQHLLNPGATKVTCFSKCQASHGIWMPMMVVDVQPDEPIQKMAGGQCGNGRTRVENLCVLNSRLE